MTIRETTVFMTPASTITQIGFIFKLLKQDNADSEDRHKKPVCVRKSDRCLTAPERGDEDRDPGRGDQSDDRGTQGV